MRTNKILCLIDPLLQTTCILSVFTCNDCAERNTNIVILKVSLSSYLYQVHFQVKDAHEKAAKECAENRQALLIAQRKDEKSAEMIAELTNVSKTGRLRRPLIMSA